MIQKIIKFYNEVIKEFKSVSWPKKEQIMGSTIITIIVTVILSLFVLVVDKILERLIMFIL